MIVLQHGTLSIRVGLLLCSIFGTARIKMVRAPNELYPCSDYLFTRSQHG